MVMTFFTICRLGTNETGALVALTWNSRRDHRSNGRAAWVVLSESILVKPIHPYEKNIIVPRRSDRSAGPRANHARLRPGQGKDHHRRSQVREVLAQGSLRMPNRH